MSFLSDNILLMGDFNADCSYVGKTKLKALKLKKSGYHWLIPDDADTTVSSTDCAYDRSEKYSNTLAYKSGDHASNIY